MHVQYLHDWMLPFGYLRDSGTTDLHTGHQVGGTRGAYTACGQGRAACLSVCGSSPVIMEASVQSNVTLLWQLHSVTKLQNYNIYENCKNCLGVFWQSYYHLLSWYAKFVSRHSYCYRAKWLFIWSCVCVYLMNQTFVSAVKLFLVSDLPTPVVNTGVGSSTVCTLGFRDFSQQTINYTMRAVRVNQSATGKQIA